MTCLRPFYFECTGSYYIVLPSDSSYKWKGEGRG